MFVVAAVVSSFESSSWLFLSVDDCFDDGSLGPADWTWPDETWPGSAGWAAVLAFVAGGCVAALVPLAFCAFAAVGFCGEAGLEGAEVDGFGFAAACPFWLCAVCAGAVSLPLPVVVLVPDDELFFVWKLPLCHGEPAVGVGAGELACIPVSGCAAASSRAENGSDAASCWLAAAAAARCCEDWINDDVELTSDAILGTARSLKARGQSSRLQPAGQPAGAKKSSEIQCVKRGNWTGASRRYQRRPGKFCRSRAGSALPAKWRRLGSALIV